MGGHGVVALPRLGPPGDADAVGRADHGTTSPRGSGQLDSALAPVLPGIWTAWVRCLPVDPNGYAEVPSTVSGIAGVAPVVLAHDLSGQQGQALVHVLEAASCTVQVFFVALCLPSTTDGDDAASLMAFAIRQWGTRIVQRADEVAPL